MPCPLWVKSGHLGKSTRCLLYPRKRTFIRGSLMSACANSGHFTTHSITSSAMDNTAAGIASPRPFAAFRLSTNSNFVG